MIRKRKPGCALQPPVFKKLKESKRDDIENDEESFSNNHGRFFIELGV